MEPITHALSGAVLIQTLPKTVRPGWMLVWGALVAASPDADIFFVRNPLEYIEYHRGITHSFVGAVPMALLLGLLFLACLGFVRWRRAVPYANAEGGWTVQNICILAYVLILHHLWLDCTNSYGTQLFLPFNEYRVRLSGLFIVDLLLLIPLAVGLLWKRNSQRVMAALLIWTLLYPAGAVAGRWYMERNLREALPEIVQNHTVTNAYLTPDVFAPFHWKLILESDAVWLVTGYTLPQPLSPSQSIDSLQYTVCPKPPSGPWNQAAAEDRAFRVYKNFAQFPTLEAEKRLPDGTEYIFSDLRFGSTMQRIDELQTRTSKDGYKTFRIMARFTTDNTLTAVRFLTGSGAGGDSGWNAPVPH